MKEVMRGVREEEEERTRGAEEETGVVGPDVDPDTTDVRRSRGDDVTFKPLPLLPVQVKLVTNQQRALGVFSVSPAEGHLAGLGHSLSLGEIGCRDANMLTCSHMLPL